MAQPAGAHQESSAPSFCACPRIHCMGQVEFRWNAAVNDTLQSGTLFLSNANGQELCPRLWTWRSVLIGIVTLANSSLGVIMTPCWSHLSLSLAGTIDDHIVGVFHSTLPPRPAAESAWHVVWDGGGHWKYDRCGHRLHARGGRKAIAYGGVVSGHLDSRRALRALRCFFDGRTCRRDSAQRRAVQFFAARAG